MKLYLTYTILIWLAFTAAVSCSALRYHIQKQRFGRLLLDDYIHIFALTQLIGSLLCGYISSASYHELLNYESPEVEVLYDVTNFVTLLFNVTSLYAIKAMFLTLYWRIFAISPAYRILWWLSAGFTVAAFLGSFLQNFWFCGGDIRKLGGLSTEVCAWSEADIGFTIRSTSVLMALNVSSDLIVFSMPLGVFSKLQISRQKKYRILPIFLLGSVTIAMDAISCITMIVSVTNDNSVLPSVGLLFTLVEPSIAIIVGCMPVLLFAGHGKFQANSNFEIIPSRRGQQGPAAGTRTTESVQNRWFRAGRRERQLLAGGSTDLLASDKTMRQNTDKMRNDSESSSV